MMIAVNGKYLLPWALLELSRKFLFSQKQLDWSNEGVKFRPNEPSSQLCHGKVLDWGCEVV